MSGSAGNSRPTARPVGTVRRCRSLRAWSVLTVLAGIFLIPVGALLVAVGHADDSPGLGGMGLIRASIGLVMVIRVLVARRSR